MSVVITPFEKKHVGALVAIDAAVSAAPWAPAHFEAELKKKHARFWVIENDAAAIAFGGIWLLDDRAEIPNLAVHVEWRRRGFGGRLLAFLCAQAKQAGAKKISLEVRENNEAARKLYRAHDFKETSRRPRFYNGQIDAVLMEKILE